MSKEMNYALKDYVDNKFKAVKEMFDFLYNTITDISSENPEYYKAMSEEYDAIMKKIYGGN